MTQLLLGVSAIQFLMSYWSDIPYKWLDGLTVAFAALFSALLTAYCDYLK